LIIKRIIERNGLMFLISIKETLIEKINGLNDEDILKKDMRDIFPFYNMNKRIESEEKKQFFLIFEEYIEYLNDENKIVNKNIENKYFKRILFESFLNNT
jgi:hypothetical protein